MSVLGALASLSTLESAAAAVFLGVACHLTVRPYEIDNQGWKLLGLYLSIFSTVAYFYSVEHGILAALARTSIEAFAFNTGLFTSLLVYRGLFHSLRRFPGPFLVKFTRFYTTYHVAQRHENFLDLQVAHKKYGDFVRIGPRELSINRPSAIPAIYGSPTVCTRGPAYSGVSNDVAKVSLMQTRDLELHRRRRRAWERGLGFRALSAYESRVKDKADSLLARLDGSAGEPIDISKYAMFFGFDVMGEIGFSKDFGMLESGTEHRAVQGIHESMAIAVTFGTVPWLLSMLGKIPGAMGTYSWFAEWCGREVKALRASLREQTSDDKKKRDPQDVMSWLLKAEEENDNSAPPGESAFQEDARLLVIAGSDTTSAALANATYYLATNPDCYRKLVQTLQEICPRGEQDWSYEKVKAVPYLEFVINETLRLKPSAPVGLVRLTPAAGLTIDGVAIPGDVVVSVPTFTIHRDERYWDRATEFVPERWETLSTEKAPFIPFTRGPFTCPGKALAMMELRIVLSRIALRFDLALASERDGEIFDKEIKDVFTMAIPPLPMKFIKR